MSVLSFLSWHHHAAARLHAVRASAPEGLLSRKTGRGRCMKASRPEVGCLFPMAPVHDPSLSRKVSFQPTTKCVCICLGTYILFLARRMTLRKKDTGKSLLTSIRLGFPYIQAPVFQDNGHSQRECSRACSRGDRADQ